MTIHSTTRDVTAQQPAPGLGHGSTWECWGCKRRLSSTLGRKGVGLRRRCAECVSKREAK